MQHQAGARGVPVEVDRAADPVDQRGDVLDLPINRMGERVAAVPATSPVVVDGREVLAERLGRGTHQGAVARGAADGDEQRAGAEDLVGDGGAVSGGDGLVRHTGWTGERGAG